MPGALAASGSGQPAALMPPPPPPPKKVTRLGAHAASRAAADPPFCVCFFGGGGGGGKGRSSAVGTGTSPSGGATPRARRRRSLGRALPCGWGGGGDMMGGDASLEMLPRGRSRGAWTWPCSRGRTQGASLDRRRGRVRTRLAGARRPFAAVLAPVPHAGWFRARGWRDLANLCTPATSRPRAGHRRLWPMPKRTCHRAPQLSADEAR